MVKKKALGTDPLRWLKMGKKEEKLDNEVINQEKETNNPPESHQINESNVEKKRQTIEISDTSDVTEKYRTNILGGRESEYKAKLSETASKESPATIFVVVYTILLLVLGFLVYRDLTKRINNIDTKISTIEKQLESSYATYDDSLFDERW